MARYAHALTEPDLRTYCSLTRCFIPGQNRIKLQAREHPKFRAIAERYGQSIHQLNMRLSVALLRNPEAEQRAKEKAEAPTVKTKAQADKEAEMLAKYGTTAKASHPVREVPQSPWKRKFRPLPEAKAVELFANVLGDSFILFVAGTLIIYESWKALHKPDANLERIKELSAQLEEVREREAQLEEGEKEQKKKIEFFEEVLLSLRDPKSKKPIVITAAS